MAETNINVTPGSGGPNIDLFAVDNGNARQVVCIGDPTSASKVLSVDLTTGLPVNITNTQVPVKTYSTPLVTAMTTTFRTVGLASAPHNIFTLENPNASGRTIAVIRLTMQCESSALSTNLVSVCAGRTSGLPTGGTVLASDKDELSGTISGIARGATASDGGAATTITATLVSRMWTQFRQRFITLAGYSTTPDNLQLPDLIRDRPILIAAGSGIVVQAVNAALTTDHYVVNCMWYEY